MNHFTHGYALRQVSQITKLAQQLNAAQAVIEHHHTSKSIRLPVPTITVKPGLAFMLRDNFHDLNLYVRSEKELDLPLDFFYKPLTFAWYQETIQSKRRYCFSDWTDEEMNDPRILRVRRKNGNGWSEVDDKEKDRWTARDGSTEWYSMDWSSGMLLTSGPVPFTDATTFYDARTAFGEGIPHSPRPYSQPCKEFMNSVNTWDDLTRLCLGIVERARKQDIPHHTP